MRKCPYCGELVAQDAVECQFCNHDLRVAPGSTSSPIAAMSMTVDDLASLFEAWGQSYSNIPDALRERWISAADPITREWLLPIVEQWFRHRVYPEAQIAQVVAQLASYCYQWAILSAAIGTEAGKGNIPDHDVPYYLAACNLALLRRLVGHLDWLLERKWIKEKESIELARKLDTYLTEKSLFLANWGHIMHSEMTPKYAQGGGSPFSVGLKRLDISELKRG